MKNLLIILLTFFLLNNIFSQDYQKFPTSNAVWNYMIAGSLEPSFNGPVIDSLGGKVTIDSKEYIKVYKASHGSSSVIGAIREDTIQKRVYFHDFTNEIVLYDFSLEVGDTIFYSTNLYYNLDYYKVVDSIDSIDISGELRKRWYLTNSYIGFNDIWIEGIGSVYRYGLLFPNDPDIIMDASTPYFGCFTDNSITYVDNNSCLGTCPCNNWLVNLSETSKFNNISLYPNPVEQTLIIDLNENNIKPNNIEIYTYTGLLIYNKELKTKQIEIDFQPYSKGIYFIKINGEGNSILKKVIKK